MTCTESEYKDALVKIEYMWEHMSEFGPSSVMNEDMERYISMVSEYEDENIPMCVPQNQTPHLDRNPREPLKDRMKRYESACHQKFYDYLTSPIIIRIDGKRFGKYTKTFDDFDTKISTAMAHATHSLLKECGGIHAYTHSDEASIIILPKRAEEQIWFGGRIMKIISVSASFFTVKFNEEIMWLDSTPRDYAMFDARAFQVPSKSEAFNAMIWRERDAIRNSISKMAKKYFTPSEIHGKNSGEMIYMIREKTTAYDDMWEGFQQGVHVKPSGVVGPVSLTTISDRENWMFNYE